MCIWHLVSSGCCVKPTVHKTAFHNLAHKRWRGGGEREKEGGGGGREGKYLDYTYKNEEDVYADLPVGYFGVVGCREFYLS